MAYLLYNTLLTIFLIVAAPYFLFRALIDGRFRREWIQRMGFLPTLSPKKTIWFHAASVGEVFCSIPLLKRIKEEFPECPIVLTTMTRTGNERAKTIPEADLVFFLPIDHPLVIRRALRKIDPGLLLIAETELWPNLLRSCGTKGIPIVLFNGRISEKSFRRYLFFKFFFKDCLKYVSLFLMQTEEDRNRIIEIGATMDKTRVVGNLKFDQPFPTFTPLESPTINGGDDINKTSRRVESTTIPPMVGSFRHRKGGVKTPSFLTGFTQEALAEMAKSLNLRGKETLLIAGSTHSGEEEILFSLLKDLRKIDPHLVLILAPRHLERLEEVERILKRESISWTRKTSLSTDQDRPDGERKELPEVILLDTMGELMNLYSLGTLVFIGGSLVPVGGHNPIEPLFFKKCVLFGPHMFHFLEISHHLIEAGGAIQVRGKEDLAFQLKRLLSDERARKEVGEKGYQFLQKHRGATEKMFEEIRPFLTRMQNFKFL
jgi:3-deoxy-D-manno-octulosonic-acid transferase